MSSGIKVALGILGGALLVLVVVLAFGSGGFFGPGPMMGQGGMMGSQGWGPGSMMRGSWGAWGIVLMLVPLLFWVGLLVLIGWAVVRIVSALEHRGGTPHHTHGSSAQGTSAEEILKERFARGEIDAKEFEERRRVLRGEDR
jgi:putative membrane protein